MKIKFDSDDNITLNKTIEIAVVQQLLEMFLLKMINIIHKVFWMNVYIRCKIDIL